MRWTRWTAVGSWLAVALLAVTGLSCTNTTAQVPAEMTAAEKVARGKVMAYTSGCVDCHTPGAFYGAPDTTRMLSGSDLGWQGPWGTSYARNLTPDPETGIGSWSEDDIVTAFRAGHRPDKSPILPPMPWPGFAHMSDEDAYALAAYLKSLPPIPHQLPAVVPPGGKPTTPIVVLPPPPAWDAQNMPPPPSTPATGS